MALHLLTTAGREYANKFPKRPKRACSMSEERSAAARLSLRSLSGCHSVCGREQQMASSPAMCKLFASSSFVCRLAHFVRSQIGCSQSALLAEYLQTFGNSVYSWYMAPHLLMQCNTEF